MVDPYINPFFLLRIASSYLFDVNRLWNIDFEKLKRYQDKSFSNIVKFAYTVPLYYEKYKKFGVHPRDIKSIDDIRKLPLISKDDIRNNYPDGIIPKGFNKNQGFKLSTSGSTGKPVFVYCDMFSATKSLLGFIRALKSFGGNWNKLKIVMIIDTSIGSMENAVFTSGAFSFMKKFFPLNNIKYIDILEKPKDVLKIVDDFQPDFLGSDPNMLMELSYLKNNGYGLNLNPSIIVSGGGMLNRYAKNYIKNAFDVKVFDTYGTTEAGPLAFECAQGDYYHVHSDFVYPEVLDDNEEQVSLNESGHIVITKLYGSGTPIIRYTGFDDFVTPVQEDNKCGITSQLIKQIDGRSTDLFVLPNGNMLSPLTVTGIPAKIMDDFNTYKIRQFQIIQNKIDEIEILIIIDDKLRNKGPSVDKIFSELKKRFSEKIGLGVNINVREVSEISKKDGIRKDKVVVSNVKPKLD